MQIRDPKSETREPCGFCRQTLVACLLVLCVVLVGFWEIMSTRSGRPFDPFELTNKDFEGYMPQSENWQIRSVPVSTTAIEPNIAAFRLQRTRPGSPSISVRLVHGYNMCDCMRIKGYDVELIADNRENGEEIRSQIWRLTTGTGDTSVWTTSMLRAGDFEATGTDIRSMAFPRIGIPDDPSWMPRGLTLKSLRHPVRNFRNLLRAKWNNSRRDILTFLGLKRPAWASDDMLTLVTAFGGLSAGAVNERQAISQAASAHSFMLAQLQLWRKNQLADVK